MTIPQTIGAGGNTPQAIPKLAVTGLLNLGTDEARIARMAEIGVENVSPPLSRSSHLRIKSTGVVLPWNELLAEQTTLVDNCDVNGNVDPAAWEPTVVVVDPEDERAAMMRAQANALTRARGEYTAFTQPVSAVTVENAIPAGTVVFADINNLMELINS